MSQPGDPASGGSKERGSGLGGRLARLILAREDEIAALLWAALLHFCILSSYFILRPVRDAMGLLGGVRGLPWLFTGTMAAMFVANPLFAALVARFPRRRFLPWVYRFILGNLVLFWLLFSSLSEEAGVHVARAFYIWLSVFNLFAVSVFWGFMADLFSTEQGKRLFPFIGLGGTAGALAGAAFTGAFAVPIGPVNLLLVSAALLEVAVACIRRLVRIFGVDRAEADGSPAASGSAGRSAPIGGGVWSGVERVVRSPYLLGIAIFVFLYSTSSTFAYFIQATIVDRAIPETPERVALFARIDFGVQSLTIALQLFLAGRVIRAVGVGVALAFLPLVSLLGFAGVGAAPLLGVLVGFQIVRKASEYAFSKPAREVLYTVLAREDKYKAKPFIDTFVYRGGDALSAWIAGHLTVALGVAGLAYATVPLAFVWIALAFVLGWRHRTLAVRAREPASDPGG